MATLAKPRSATSTARRRIASAEWQRVGDDLDAQGFAVAVATTIVVRYQLG